MRVVINVFLSMARNYMTPEVYAQIKDAVKKVATEMPDRGDGERTAFVIKEIGDIVAASPNPYDDILFAAIVPLMLRKYT